MPVLSTLFWFLEVANWSAMYAVVRGVGFEPTNALLCFFNMWVTKTITQELDIKKTGRKFYLYFIFQFVKIQISFPTFDKCSFIF
jgi:hypothetical protein